MTINFFILIWVQMIFDYFCKKLISYDETQDVEKLREYFKDFMDGLLSFPLNIPGTAFHACLQVPYQKNILTYIEYFFCLNTVLPYMIMQEILEYLWCCTMPI